MIAPDDEANRALLANVHPPGWVAPKPRARYDLVVIGAGTAGLVCAVGAASLGARVAIVEKHFMGGDCLNFGCVPSKAVLRAARAAQAVRGAAVLGVATGGEARVDFAAIMARMRRIRAEISRHDSAQRLASLGVDVFLGAARFVARDTVEVAGARLRFARAVLATGTRPAVPDVPGLAEAGYLTNETVFSLTERPARLAVVGGGPIGCELGQAFRRFGSEVTIVTRGARLLPRDDADAAALLAAALEREGVGLRFGATPARVERRDGAKVLSLKGGAAPRELVVDEILLAVGRTPNVSELGLESAGIAVRAAHGVEVDDRLRTTNERVYAAGDVCSPYKFTHTADAMARIVIQNALFFGRKKMSALTIPWCTYTDPEIAHVGHTEAQARARGHDVVTHHVDLAAVDRAILDGEEPGFARVHVERRSGRILGATMVASHAGDMLGEIAVAMTSGLGISSIAATIHPYPTQSEAWKKLADAHARTRLTPAAARVLKTLIRLRSL